jgi:hypothetical protein
VVPVDENNNVLSNNELNMARNAQNNKISIFRTPIRSY